MNNKQAFIAALAATTVMTGGFAFAANENSPAANPPAKQEATVNRDAARLSADASQAFRDVAATRLAIFDGRVDDAKKDVNEAATSFNKAKKDRSVFMKAENELKPPGASGTMNKQKTDAPDRKPDHSNATKPVAWLPVDGQILLNEDYRFSPQKNTAVADANKSLAHDDRNGAVEKLKLAGVDVDYVVAVVPLDQTLTDVHKATDMLNDSKYYEASQMLRNVQNSVRVDVVDIAGRPKAASAKAADDAKPAATH